MNVRCRVIVYVEKWDNEIFLIVFYDVVGGVDVSIWFYMVSRKVSLIGEVWV